MLNEQDKTALIEKYFLNNLSTEEQQLFDKLQRTDEEFAVEVTFYSDFMGSTEAFGNQQLKAHFQQLEVNIQATEAKQTTSQSSFAKLNEQINYTIDQLIALFLPVPSYSKVMAYTNRSKGLTVLNPKQEMDCKGTLHFELQTLSASPLKVQIENNQQKIILEQTYLTHELFFMVDLPNELAPGIYYWKLSNKEVMLMGAFYIHKDLMPEVRD